ncbi:hypothetical protein IWX49DRAFT_507925 [Phyllosticta citricarpa]|uniref:DH domain-containing protein n=1 Tax=Phyllosticta paracitricarpa TaxID=2016321 RepID=A0ABR1N0B7_9PEZI
MAYVLSVPSHSPLKRSFSETPYLRSPSPLSHDSANTVRRCKPSNVSATSLISFASAQNGPWLRPNENNPPNVASRSLLDLINELSSCPSLHSSLECVPEKISWVSNIPLPPSPDPRRTSFEQTALSIHVDRPSEKCPSPVPTFHEDPNSASESGDSPTDDRDAFFSSASSILETPEDPTDSFSAPVIDEESDDDVVVEEGEPETKATPFKRWVSTLRRRNKNPAKGHKPRSEHLPVDDFPAELSRIRTEHEARSRSGHKKSSSLASSMAFVTAVKSASVTLASTSIAPLSRLGTRYSRGRDDHRGSSITDARSARDTAYQSIIPVMDERAWERAKQRRRILEEIISSEEGYIGDLKVLSNVYLTVLASVPSVSPQTRMSIHRNVSQLVQLHEDLLGELHRIIPNSEFTQDDSDAEHRPRPRHTRWHSIDGLPHRASGIAINRRSHQRHSLDMCKPEEPTPLGVTADTETVARIARLFDQLMRRFFAYEEYSAQFESVNNELEASHRAIPAWQTYERGIEALSSMLVSANKRDASCRKGLTLADLMIKASPIQRTSKYPLFFADLMKHTPVADDPVAHAELEKVHFRLKDANQEINNAKDDPLRRKLIETTWLLQDRLVFAQDQPIPRVVLTRLLGHVVLCGVLHVTYQTNDPRIHGKYMICMLFRSCLILAQTDKSYSTYNVFAMIALGNGSIERSDNGRGLQCHTAPFTWKLIFESSNRFYEVILSACSAEEEMIWKKTLRSHISAENSDIVEGRSCMQDLFSSLSVELKCLGASFGTPDSLTRKMALRRAATVGPKMHLQQVIIKNTQAQKRPDVTQSTSSLPVGRSQSTMTSNTLTPTLAPRRGERIRLETVISDVWTKESIPYPGMGTRRAENPIRASANSVMRKLSMASIASNFSSKRSGSYNSLSQLRKDDPWKSRRRSPSGTLSKSASPAPPCIKVDFHSAPDQFLPADFELVTPNNRARRKGNRANLSERESDRIVGPGTLPRGMSISPSPRPSPHSGLSKKISMPSLGQARTPSTRDGSRETKLRRKLSMPTMSSSPLLANAYERPATAAGPAATPKLEVKLPQCNEQDDAALTSLPSSPGATPSRKKSINVKPRTRLFKFWAHRSESPKGVLASIRANTTPSRSPSRRV